MFLGLALYRKITKLITIIMEISANNPSAHSPLSRYFPNETLRNAGKALRRKCLGHRQKSDPLRCANPQKKRNRSTPGTTFLTESAGSVFLSRFVFDKPVETSPCSLIHIPDPFRPIPFFEKAKFRNLEISRPYS